MCGICGFYGFSDKELVKEMVSVLAHRGPEDSGTFIDNTVCLGHSRLKIIDLDGGKQPFTFEGKTIVYNGEVYNYVELREELEKLGHSFSTSSDTEVVLHSYIEWKEKCVEKFNGMWAFVIYDQDKKQLFCSRDKYGIKPFFYLVHDNNFLFASEAKALLKYSGYVKKINKQAFHELINLRFIPGEHTIFKGIKRLPLGHNLTFSENGLSVTKYYENVFKEDSSITEAFAIKKIPELLKDSVDKHFRSDVPVGILLSGGLDSAAILSMANELGRENIKTFTMGFTNEADEEIHLARKLSDHYSTEHKEVFRENTLFEEYPKLIWYADTPKRNLYPYYVYETVKQSNIKVVQTGLGGDELFGGYPWKYNHAMDVDAIRQRAGDNLQNVKDCCQQIINFQSKFGQFHDYNAAHYLKKIQYLDHPVDSYTQIVSYDEVFDKSALDYIYGGAMDYSELNPIHTSFEPYFSKEQSLIENISSADFNVKMVDDFIFVDDSMSMAHSVESRVPFLENNLVDFASRIPSSLKCDGIKGKRIFRKSMKDHLPSFILEEKKRGFGSNILHSYTTELKSYAESILPNGAAVSQGLISSNYLKKVLDHVPHPILDKHYAVLWTLLSFEVWFEVFFNRDGIKPKEKLDNFF